MYAICGCPMGQSERNLADQRTFGKRHAAPSSLGTPTNLYFHPPGKRVPFLPSLFFITHCGLCVRSYNLYREYTLAGEGQLHGLAPGVTPRHFFHFVPQPV